MKRIIKHFQVYTKCIAHEAGLRERAEAITEKMSVDDFMQFRRDGSGISMACDTIETSAGIDLPEDVFEDVLFQNMYKAALDLCNLTNVSSHRCLLK